MATVYLAPTFGAGYQGFSVGGLPLNGGLIYTYLAGGTTPKETYTTSAGSVQCANPIVLGIDGRPPTEIWLVSGFAYRFDLKDSLGNLIKTYDNLSGVGDPLLTASAFGVSLMAGASAAVDRGLLGLADATAKGDTLSATAAGAFTRKAVGSNGQVLAADSSQADGLVWTDYLRPNLLINPNWLIDQVNEGALYTVNSTVAGPDGWTGVATAASGVFKLRQLTDPDNAALKCLEITCTTIDAAIASGDQYTLFTAIEGYDMAALGWGTASALPVTLTFKFKTSVVGVYGVSMSNSAGNRSYVSIITVANTNENTYTLTVPGDTAGVWLYMNGGGAYLQLALAAGSTYQTTAGAWGGAGFLTTAAQVNFMSSVSNIAYLKRVQLTAGSIVTGFAPQDYQKELAKCQRYYAKSFAMGTAPVSNVGTIIGGFEIGAFRAGAVTMYGPTLPFPVRMRATPTMTTFNPTAAGAEAQDLTGGTCTGTTAQANDGAVQIFTVGNAATAVGNRIGVHWTANARLS